MTRDPVGRTVQQPIGSRTQSTSGVVACKECGAAVTLGPLLDKS